MPKNPNYSFTEAQVVKLLRLYKKEKLLWNKNMPEYKDRSLRLAAMRRVVRGMSVPKLEVKHVTFKLRMLRDMYVRELKKIGVKSGKYGRSFPYWFYRMHFLKDHLNTTVDLSGIQIKQYTEEEERYFGLDEESDQCAVEEGPLDPGPDGALLVKREEERDRDPDRDHDRDVAGSGRIVLEPLPRPAEAPRLENGRFDGNSSSEVADGRAPSPEVVRRAILRLLENEKSHQKSDYFDNFAKYVASLLRALPKSKAFELQPKIISMITEEHKKLSGPPESGNGHY